MEKRIKRYCAHGDNSYLYSPPGKAAAGEIRLKVVEVALELMMKFVGYMIDF